MHLLRITCFALAVALGLAGCRGCPPEPAEPVAPPERPPSLVIDSGPPVPADPDPPPDAGPHYSGNHAGEACPPELFVPMADGGTPDGSIPFGLCIALRTLSGTARLNGQPVTGDIELQLEAGNAQGDITRAPNGEGYFEVRAMRFRYDVLRYHPAGIFPSHQGPQELGVIDLRQDRTKDLDVKSWSVRGNVSFAGAPWGSSTLPPDVQLAALGLPPQQSVAARSQAGTYEVSLIEGTFGIGLTVPREALGETEVLGWPVSLATLLTADTSIDMNIPASQLSGQFTLDGAAFPDRRPGFDYSLEYVSPGASSPVARTVHEGGSPEIQALVPRGKYSVLLTLDSTPDRHLPSMLYEKQVAAGFDLTQDASASFALTTFELEGAITIDGVAVPPVPNYNFFLYAWAYDSPTAPSFLAYYEVPLDGPTFSLRAFPATYYFALYIDEHYRPDLVEGWFIVDPQYEVSQDRQLPIQVWTSPLDGRLTVDGQPAPPGSVVGTLTFQSRDAGVYRRRLITEDDGSFHLRVPKGIYDLYFEIDPATFPQYATGRQRLQSDLRLDSPQVVELDYRTVPVSGPLRVGGDPVPDTQPGRNEVGLVLRRSDAFFEWGFAGGSPDYVMRLPVGEYQLTFRIEADALPGVAHGQAAVGASLLVK